MTVNINDDNDDIENNNDDIENKTNNETKIRINDAKSGNKEHSCNGTIKLVSI